MLRKATLILILFMCFVSAWSVNDSVPPVRPVTGAYTIGTGSLHLADTYLTPLHYHGWQTAAEWRRDQAMRFAPTLFSNHLGIGVDLGRTLNPAHTATMWKLDIEVHWGMYRKWQGPEGLMFTAGGQATLNAGVLYLGRNGNNPATALARFSLDATGGILWRSKLKKQSFTLGYRASIPLTGAFFAPQYGQLYYEIYLGQHGGLAHFLWPGNYRRLRNEVFADLHFKGTTLRIGYNGIVFSEKANSIVTQQISHSLVLGIVTEWISLNTGHKELPQGEIIKAY